MAKTRFIIHDPEVILGAYFFWLIRSVLDHTVTYTYDIVKPSVPIRPSCQLSFKVCIFL